MGSLYQAVEKPFGQEKWGSGEQVTAEIPQSVRHFISGQAAVQPQVGTLNRIFNSLI